MNFKNYLFGVILAFGITSSLFSQDIHFTMWDMSPLTVNPAYTGAFSGSVRIGGIYRDQFRSVIKPFTTPSFYVDAPLFRGLRKNDWIGLGGAFFSDKAGSLKLSYGAIVGSAAYHLALNKSATSVLTIGLQAGQKQRKIELENALFEDEVNSPGSSVDRARTNEDNGVSFTDFGGGVMLKTTLNKNMDATIGFSVGHALRPKYNLHQNTVVGEDKRPLLTNLHGQFNIAFSEKWSITPQFYYQSTSGATEVSVQNWAGYKLNENYKLRAGAGYRLGDALQVLLGLDNKDLRVTAAYDVNISELSDVSNFKGGFEIAAWYIIKIYKKPDVKPAILCPKL